MSSSRVVSLASAFQLLIFGLVNVAVVVMRESRIPGYVPGYRSPLYPWVQILGILAPIPLARDLALDVASAPSVSPASTPAAPPRRRKKRPVRAGLFLTHFLKHVPAVGF